MALEKRKRRGILSLLYTKRVNVPDQPALALAEMADLLGCAREHLEVSLWYLTKRGWVERSDNGRFGITVDGFDEAETHGTWQVPRDRLLTDGRDDAPDDDPIDNPNDNPRDEVPDQNTSDTLREVVARYRL